MALNGLFLPANIAVQQARRCCVPIHFATGDGAWPVANRGTGVLYRYCGRQFCVFTRHQLGHDVHPSQVALKLTDSDRHLFSGARYVEFPHIDAGPEEHDICAIEFPWSIPKPSSLMFFDAVPLRPLEEPIRFFALGYPSKLTLMHEDEAPDGAVVSAGIHMSQMLVWGEHLEVRDGDLPKLTLMSGQVMRPVCGGDFDGFSGGPVFGVNAKSLAIELHGIVIRGGIDKLFFAPTQFVNSVCELALKEPRVRILRAA